MSLEKTPDTDARPLTADHVKTGPFFIGGLDRSGKTILNHLLAAHPNLVITRRTYMWTRYLDRFGDLSQSGNLERCLSAMIANSAIKDLQPDLRRIRTELIRGTVTYERLFGLFLQHNAERLGKIRWGDQLGSIERYADRIFKAYPDARFIHMIRDPRDWMQTSAGKRNRPGKTGWLAAVWQNSARLAQRNRKLYPNQYLVICFESLLHDPESTLKTICGFLGERYHPAITDAINRIPALSEEETTVNEDGLRDKDPLPRTLSRIDLVVIQSLIAQEMEVFGYPKINTELSFPNRLSYSLITLPANLAGALWWKFTQSPRSQERHL